MINVLLLICCPLNNKFVLLLETGFIPAYGTTITQLHVKSSVLRKRLPVFLFLLFLNQWDAFSYKLKLTYVITTLFKRITLNIIANNTVKGIWWWLLNDSLLKGDKMARESPQQGFYLSTLYLKLNGELKHTFTMGKVL